MQLDFFFQILAEAKPACATSHYTNRQIREKCDVKFFPIEVHAKTVLRIYWQMLKFVAF